MTTPTLLGRPRAVALAIVLAAVGIPLPASAVADTTAPAPSAPTLGVVSNDAVARSVQAGLEYSRDVAQLIDIDRRIIAVEKRTEFAQLAFHDLDSRFNGDQTQLAGAISRLRGRAVVTYERNGALIGATLEIQHLQALQAGLHYIDSAANADTTEVARLDTDLTALKADHDGQAALVRGLQNELTALSTQHDRLASQGASDRSTLDQLGGVPVLGPTQLTAPQIVDWFQATDRRPHLSGATTIDQIARLYVDEGAAAGVRGDLAFAQAIIESGSFGHATDNNYAGIGACDGCKGEPGFPSPQSGVRAQVQLLRNYADPDSRAAKLAYPPDPTLFGGDPTAAAANYDTFYLKGKVPLWNQMGHGNWATDPNYAAKVLRIYAQMLAHATPPT